MNPLPAAPLTAPAPGRVSPFQPATSGHIIVEADGRVSRSPSPPLSFSPSLPLITGEQLTAHLQSATAWRSLPDGRPLTLTAAGMEYMLDDFEGFQPGELRSAHRLLYFATRTPAQMEALWVPPVPRTDAPAPEPMALHIRTLCAHIGTWAAETFAPCAMQGTMELAFRLWMEVVERLPVSAEKKSPPPAVADPAQSPGSASPSSAKCAGSSPAEMPSVSASSTPAPMSATSSTPILVGPTNTNTGSLPIPSAPAVSLPPGD